MIRDTLSKILTEFETARQNDKFKDHPLANFIRNDAKENFKQALGETAKDYISTGPWVEKVESRVGVDTTNNDKIDKWSKWSEVKESYDYIKGFSKQIKKTPARQNLAGLPPGYGFQIEVKISDVTSNASKPLIESLDLSFRD